MVDLERRQAQYVGAEPKWWLVGPDSAYGPFWKREIASRVSRYLIYRHYSSASRRVCWAKAGEDPFQGDARRA